MNQKHITRHNITLTEQTRTTLDRLEADTGMNRSVLIGLAVKFFALNAPPAFTQAPGAASDGSPR
jgi:hypothetical protein